MNRILVALLAVMCLASARAEDIIRSHHAVKTLEIYRHIVEVDTSKTRGNTLGVARYLAEQLLAAGFPEADIEVLDIEGFGALVARYAGDGSSGKAPILLLGHMDVVEANPEGLGAAAIHAHRGRRLLLWSGYTGQQIRHCPTDLDLHPAQAGGLYSHPGPLPGVHRG